MRKFLDEALTMREFCDNNVLQLIGIVVNGNQMPLVILPFMTHGDLLSYIRNEHNASSLDNFVFSIISLSAEDLLKFFKSCLYN